MFITCCRLTIHDYVYYASREMGRLYETEKYLHNYGLTYALGLARSPFANHSQVPHYNEDLEPLNEQGIYVTPASPVQWSFAFHTFKMAETNYYSFTPQISSNQAVFGRAKEIAPESIFQFFVLSEQTITLPRWIRLGKWMAKAHVHIMSSQKAHRKEGHFHIKGVMNPLDTLSIPIHCNIIAMAPSSLLTSVHYNGSYYEGEDGTTTKVQFPTNMRYLVRRTKSRVS